MVIFQLIHFSSLDPKKYDPYGYGCSEQLPPRAFLRRNMKQFGKVKLTTERAHSTQEIFRTLSARWVSRPSMMGHRAEVTRSVTNFCRMQIWRFPKIGIPPNHPFIDGMFHCKPSSYWGTPVVGNLDRFIS